MPNKLKPSAVVLRIPDGQELALSTDGSWTIRFDPVAKRLKFKCGGLDVASLDAAGNFRQLGQPAGSKSKAV